MTIDDTYDIRELVPGCTYSIVLTGLGDRTATLKFENSTGFHEFTENGTSSGDVFDPVVVVPLSQHRQYTTIRVELDAGSEKVELNWIQLR